MNTIQNKRVFKIALFQGCPIYGKLTIDKENKGYLKYYDKFGEILVDLDNYNKLVIESIVNQAEVICLMKHSTLWSY
jgi:hypothetical protein